MLIFLSVFIAVLPATLSKLTYQLTFPEVYTSSYAKLYGTIDHPLVDYTLCHWSKINVIKTGTVFSYINDTFDDLIMTSVEESSYVQLFTNSHSSSRVSTGAQKSNWLHVCFTRATVEGNWKVFVNGAHKSESKFGQNARPIPPNGVVILGQNQDVNSDRNASYAIKFATNREFTGQITEVHLWDYILSPSNITNVYTCTFPEEGNVIGWSQRAWELHNGALISMVSLPCGDKQ